MSLRLHIDSFGDEGEGLARHEGKIVFVPGALPGEDVEVELADCGKRHDRGELTAIINPAPQRRASPCVYDIPGGCGGCSLLHVSAQDGAQLKTAYLREQLARIGVEGTCVEAPRIPLNMFQGHRNHARFIPDRKGRLAWISKADASGTGARTLVAVDHCLALHPLLEKLRKALDGRCAGVAAVDMRCAASTGDCLVVFEAESMPRDLDPVGIGAHVVLRTRKGDKYLRGIPALHEEIEGVRLRISAGTFFQGHAAGATTLVALVRELAGPLTAKTRAVDLCSGVGLFALTSLNKAGKVVAVEADPVATADLRSNAASYRHVSVLELTAAEAIENLDDPRGVAEVMVVDPPRSGLGKRVAAAMAKMHVPRVVLVSCDIRHFCDETREMLREGYVLERCIPVDQFPGTPHLEMVASFQRG